jgi:hypothetical protein
MRNAKQVEIQPFSILTFENMNVPNINFYGFRPKPKMAAFKRLRKTGLNGDREQLNSI